MPSFRSASRGVYRIRKRERGSAEDVSSAAGETASTSDERKRDSDMARKRGSSLPVQSTLVSVKVLPSRHSYFDPDPKRIPLNVIETDYLHAGDERIPDRKKTGEDLKDREDAEAEDVEMNSKTLENVRRALIECIDQRIVAGTRSNGCYRLLLNADLLDKVSLDILRMSDREPSGFNGCRLRTRLQRLQSTDMDFGCVRPIAEAEAEETFEIILSLRESSRSPARKRSPLDNVRSLILACHRPRLQHVEVHVGEAYQLEKVRIPNDRRPSSVACC